jgi:hypothetical protein
MSEKLTDFMDLDFELSWLENIFTGLETAFNNVKTRSKDSDWFDPDDDAAHIEHVLGIAFVAAQSYINMTCSDICREFSLNKDEKWSLMKNYGQKVTGYPDVSAVYLIYQLGNYWKHCDEWKNFKTDDKNKHIIEVLNAVGITDNAHYILPKCMDLLSWDGTNFSDVLLELLASWREDIINHLK